jgi:hypothetical protein
MEHETRIETCELHTPVLSQNLKVGYAWKE